MTSILLPSLPLPPALTLHPSSTSIPAQPSSSFACDTTTTTPTAPFPFPPKLTTLNPSLSITTAPTSRTSAAPPSPFSDTSTLTPLSSPTMSVGEVHELGCVTGKVEGEEGGEGGREREGEGGDADRDLDVDVEASPHPDNTHTHTHPNYTTSTTPSSPSTPSSSSSTSTTSSSTSITLELDGHLHMGSKCFSAGLDEGEVGMRGRQEEGMKMGGEAGLGMGIGRVGKMGCLPAPFMQHPDIAKMQHALQGMQGQITQPTSTPPWTKLNNPSHQAAQAPPAQSTSTITPTSTYNPLSQAFPPPIPLPHASSSSSAAAALPHAGAYLDFGDMTKTALRELRAFGLGRLPGLPPIQPGQSQGQGQGSGARRRSSAVEDGNGAMSIQGVLQAAAMRYQQMTQAQAQAQAGLNRGNGNGNGNVNPELAMINPEGGSSYDPSINRWHNLIGNDMSGTAGPVPTGPGMFPTVGMQGGGHMPRFGQDWARAEQYRAWLAAGYQGGSGVGAAPLGMVEVKKSEEVEQESIKVSVCLEKWMSEELLDEQDGIGETTLLISPANTPEDSPIQPTHPEPETETELVQSGFKFFSREKDNSWQMRGINPFFLGSPPMDGVGGVGGGRYGVFGESASGDEVEMELEEEGGEDGSGRGEDEKSLVRVEMEGEEGQGGSAPRSKRDRKPSLAVRNMDKSLVSVRPKPSPTNTNYRAIAPGTPTTPTGTGRKNHIRAAMPSLVNSLKSEDAAQQTKDGVKPLAKGFSRGRGDSISGKDLKCFNCQTVDTPMWRRNEKNEIMCNACGLFYRTNGTYKPLPGSSGSSDTGSSIKAGTKRRISYDPDIPGHQLEDASHPPIRRQSAPAGLPSFGNRRRKQPPGAGRQLPRGGEPIATIAKAPEPAPKIQTMIDITASKPGTTHRSKRRRAESAKEKARREAA